MVPFRPAFLARHFTRKLHKLSKHNLFMKSKTLSALAALTAAAAILLASAGCASSSHHANANASGVKAYPLKTCMVTDDALDKDAIVFVHQGQEIKICCEGCKEDFNKEPAKYLTKLAKK
jgi:hypothetical protein